MNRMTTQLSRGRTTLFLILGMIAIVAAPSSFADWQEAEEPEQQRRYGDRVSIFSGDIRVPANVDRRGLIFSLGGDVTIEGSVHEVVVVFGRLNLRGGTVRDQAVGVMSEIELTDGVIGGQLVNVLGTLHRNGTRIDGPTVNINMLSWFPGVSAAIFWGRVFLSFVAFIALLLLATLVPDRIRIIGEAAAEKYVAAFFVGILGYLGLAVIFTLLVATVIGIPVALLGFYVFKWMGVAGIFFVVGQRIGRGFGVEMSLLGAVLLAFTIFTALRLVPGLFGIPGVLLSLSLWTLFFLLIEIPAVELVILTRLGTVGGGRSMPSMPGYPAPSSAPPSGPATAAGASSGAPHAPAPTAAAEPPPPSSTPPAAPAPPSHDSEPRETD